MGYTTRRGTEITDFSPDDTDTTMYLDSSIPKSLEEILAAINEKWPGASPSNIEIGAEKIHTHCIGYDLYDPGDYTNFLVITRLTGA